MFFTKNTLKLIFVHLKSASGFFVIRKGQLDWNFGVILILNILGFVKRVFTGQVKQTFLCNKSICIL